MENICRDNSSEQNHFNEPAGCGNRRPALGFGRSVFPPDATARIFRPSRSVMTSGRARTKDWRLVFERRSAPSIEWLMGWTGGDDTLAQVELNFPTLEAAIAYAERQGLAYVVEGSTRSEKEQNRVAQETASERAFEDALSAWLSLAWLQTRYGVGGPTAPVDLERALIDPAAVFASPSDIVADPALTLQDKQNILRNWAWNEYLAELATAEGMPEGERPSRLHEVELALLALEQKARETIGIVVRQDAPGMLKAG